MHPSSPLSIDREDKRGMKAPDARPLIIKSALLLSGAIPILATACIANLVELLKRPSVYRLAISLSLFVSIVVLWLVNFFWLNGKYKMKPIPLTIETSKTKNMEAIGYLAANSFAFKALEENVSNVELVGTGMSLIMFALIYIKLDLSELNPMMYLMNYRSYEITLKCSDVDKKSKTLTLITKSKNVYPGNVINALKVNNYLYLDQG